MKLFNCLLYILSFSSFLHSQQLNDSLVSFDGLRSSIIIKRKGYVLSYDTSMLKTNCVYYLHTKEKNTKKFNRSNNFIVDSIFKGVNFNNNYKQSGYDRGHLAPAGDMTYDSIAMKESFYYSNISPQLPSFNRGIWKKLEEQTRRWVENYDSIYIFTGTIFNNDSLQFIGNDSLPIPHSFYKILLNKKGNQYTSLTFEIPNHSSNKALTSFITTIDEIEKKTKIDFVPFLDDELELKLEKSVSYDLWEFK